MDRQLTVEFPPFAIVSDNARPASWLYNPATDTRSIGTTGQIYVQEMKLDLSGYVQSDLTVGFRRSFEQEGSSNGIFWEAYNPNTDVVIETTIISSVPMNDDQLALATVVSPGFTVYNLAGADWGNFNREHMIHGRYQVMYANSVIGSGAFTSAGNATLTSLVDNYFSSLEPTAADCLYCYRVFAVPRPGAVGEDGVTQLFLPPKRVIFDAFTVEEPELEYMMRLKRSYELANQV